MGDVVDTSAPLRDRLSACIDRQPHTFFTKTGVELRDAWRIGLVHERMVDIGDRSTSLDTGEAID